METRASLEPSAEVSASQKWARRVVFSGLCAWLVLLVPLVAVAHPPVTDLPQVLTQVVDLQRWISGDDPRLEWLWWHPNGLTVWVFWLLTRPFAPAFWGVVVLLSSAAVWVGAIHAWVWTERRSLGAAWLASGLFFGPVLAWGFFNFLWGLPAFLLWIFVLQRAPAWSPLRHGVAVFLSALLLYTCHALWFGMGMFIGGLLTVFQLRSGLRSSAPDLRAHLQARALAVLPLLGLGALWYTTFYNGLYSGFMVEGLDPIERLAWPELRDAWVGGSPHAMQDLYLVALLLWLSAGAVAWLVDVRRTRVVRWNHGAALLAGSVFLLAGLWLPSYSAPTMDFALRWMPPAAVLLVLGAASWRLPWGIQNTAAVLAVVALSGAVTASWVGFHEDHMQGFDEAIAAVPEGSRLIAQTHSGEINRYLPLSRMSAWARVERGAELDFSFALFRHMSIRTRDREHVMWNPNASLPGQRARLEDIAVFDVVLVEGEPAVHASYRREPFLVPVSPPGRWQLYRVDHSALPPLPPPEPWDFDARRRARAAE